VSGDGIQLYGALYGTPAMREIFSVRRRLGAMLDVEVALARAEGQLGVIPAAAAEAIAAAAGVDRLDVETIVALTQNVGYPVVPLIQQVAQLAGNDAGRYVHWGATTQDILDTATVLQLRDAFELLESDLAAIARALVSRAQLHRGDVMAGRTHLQHALPITFGYACAVWLAPLLDHVERLRSVRERVLTLQFGGAVGTLASLGKHARDVAVALAEGLQLRVPDAPWHVDRSVFAEAAAAVGVACGSLAKIATDVALLMQTEVAEVFEPHAPGRGGSSTMPQKRNPIACEYVLATTRGVHALVPLMLQATAGDHQRSTGPWQTEEIALPQIFVLASAAFAQTRTIAEGMTVDAARMRHNVDATAGLIASEAVAMALAEHVGHSAAHAIVSDACATAITAQQPLLDELVTRPEVTHYFDRAALEQLLDPARYLGESGAIVDRVVRRAARILTPMSP
jgi:3-carboxy-cis,cis-muconate cycloisomerase